MITETAIDRPHPDLAFRHQALFYADGEDFLGATLPFVLDGLEREEPVLVAVTRPRERALKGELGTAAELVGFLHMEEVGRNPARIIPAWRRFVDENLSETQSVRGIGEPIWQGRTGAELEECRRHEALLNLAFADAPAWELLCPYDVSSLDPDTLAHACHTHPLLCERGATRSSEAYPHVDPPLDPFGGKLPEPPCDAAEMVFGLDGLGALRRLVAEQAKRAMLSAQRTSDLVLAVNELAANSVRHGGGQGMLRVWNDGESLLCEVRDDGRIGNPLAGRMEPTADQACGRGLWLVNQMCDLAEIRSSRPGTVVRVHMRLP